MNMPILHGANGSPFVRKVKVVCAEKSIEYDQDPIVPFGISDEYRKKSPLGKIPCWEDGDYTLPDSSCIGQYLEKKQPSPSLYPTDAEGFGRAIWYEEYADTKLTEVLAVAFFERLIKKMFMKMEPDEEKIAKVLAEDLPPVLDYLEGEIADREYLVGNQFGVADIAVASPFVNFAHAGESVDASRWPNLAAYVERILARPSFKECIEAEKAFFSGGQS
jgi:glutathione S-transferase